MEKITITNTRRIQSDSQWYHEVEDSNRDTGEDGCTITYWERDYKVTDAVSFNPKQSLSFSFPAEALEVGKALVELATKLLEE